LINFAATFCIVERGFVFNQNSPLKEIIFASFFFREGAEGG
jgi:hypothetical protein